MDIVRQAQMKQLAAQADARWASKSSAIDMPHRHEIASAALPQRVPDDPPEVKDPVAGLKDVANDAKEQAGKVEQIKKEEKIKRERKDIPYQGLKLGKEGEQAPESWTPKPARRR
jgi:NADH dehydrogenase [ubiquinone] 1 alpha subcomplex assembly factor 2